MSGSSMPIALCVNGKLRSAVVIKRRPSGYWEYRFRYEDRRYSKGRFKTKKQAELAEKKKQLEVISGDRSVTLVEAYQLYKKARPDIKTRTLDEFERYMERDITPLLGHICIEEISALVLDDFKAQLPAHLSSSSKNKRLTLISAILRYCCSRDLLMSMPIIPKAKETRKAVQWYTEEQRDQLLNGFLRHRPHWYFFFYITMRLGLRVGEVYAIEHRQFKRTPPTLIVDQAAQRGNTKKGREVDLKSRKNEEVLVLDLEEDILAAYDWHCGCGYTGHRFVFFDRIPLHLDNHRKPLKAVQKLVELPAYSHHKIGRHSVGSQAQRKGVPLHDIQQQLGHKSIRSTEQYAHGGEQGNVVRALRPVRPPHGGK
jgi:integrase